MLLVGVAVAAAGPVGPPVWPSGVMLVFLVGRWRLLRWQFRPPALPLLRRWLRRWPRRPLLLLLVLVMVVLLALSQPPCCGHPCWPRGAVRRLCRLLLRLVSQG